MKVNKLIKSKIERNYIFVKGELEINAKYFIKKIEQGINESTNLNYRTNLVSPMTDWMYFMNDKIFYEIIFLLNDMIDKEKLSFGSGYMLSEAWGFKSNFGDYTKLHNHASSIISGAIMLNEHAQELYFPDINEKLECKPGSFALFSGFLDHENERNKSKKVRYGLSFNFKYQSAG